jgi:hypothetical protein
MHAFLKKGALPPPGASPAPDFEADYLDWLVHQTNLLRELDYAHVDAASLIQLLEGEVAQHRRALRGRCRVLITHLLKCQYQAERQSRSCLRSIDTQRHEIDDLLLESPSLRHWLADVAAQAYVRAMHQAARETGLDRSVFPASLPYTVEQLLDEDNYAKD